MNDLPLIEICAMCGGPRPCRCERELGFIVKSRARWRSRRYLAWVRSLPCSVPHCENPKVEAAHFGPRAFGTKVHDCLAIPLCERHHRESHQSGGAWSYQDHVMEWQMQTIVAALVSGDNF